MGPSMEDRLRDSLREGFAAFAEVCRQRGPDGLRAFYHVGGRGMRARWCRPHAMTLANMRRALALLRAAGDEDEARWLLDYGRRKFGPDVILTREDALQAMAKALKVPLTDLLK